MSDILTVRDLNVYYRIKKTLKNREGRVHILKDVNFTMERGTILGIAGESGCGKSTLAKTICGLNKDYTGLIKMECESPQMIFQDHAGSLNPAKNVEWLLSEALKSDGSRKLSKEEIRERVLEAGKEANIDEKLLTRHPYELSGGQRQRVCIAAALIRRPELVVADEPVSALDVTIQAQILELLRELHKKNNISTIFISHDLRVVYNLCDRVIIMKDGRIVEEGSRDEIYGNPQSDYTKELLLASGVRHALAR